jgi:N6-L-threonylcarbamoyladenine synthase
LDRLATTGNLNAINFPRAMTLFTDIDDRANKEFSFSFSGLKSAVARHIELAVKKDGPLSQSTRADIAASFQEAVVDVLLSKAVLAAKREGLEHLLIAGGVAANSRLRTLAIERTKAAGLKLAIPSPGLCTDNGAMVAALCSLAIQAGRPASAAGLAVDPGAGVEQVLFA